MTTDSFGARPGPFDRVVLRVGGVCAPVGAIAFLTFRLLHGDTPAVDADASLTFVTDHPSYAGVHVGAVFAALLSAVGLLTLVRTLRDPIAQLCGWAGLSTALVGLAVFAVESTSEGLALPELASAAAGAPASRHEAYARAAHAVLAATHGPSLVGLSLLYGAALIALGAAILRDAPPSWLGWAGIAVGTLTVSAAVGLYLDPDLMPGFILYGLLASVAAQLWIAALAVALLRTATSTPAPARDATG